MGRAPASTHAFTTASSCSGESDSPGSTGATSTPHGTPAALSLATASTRRRGWGVPGSVSFHTSSSRVPMEKLARTSSVGAASASRSRSRRMRVDLVRMENGLRGLGQHLDDAPGEAVLALAPLVGVGVGAHGDVVARPPPGRQLGPQPLDGVDLDHDLALEVLAHAEVEVLVGGPGEAVGAGVGAAPVGVDGEAERQVGRGRDLVDDPAGVDVEELQPPELALARRGARPPPRTAAPALVVVLDAPPHGRPL